MEKFTKSELDIVNFIKAGKSKSDILTAKVTTLASLNFLLSNIYKKTDELVKYHSERNKFEELAGYIRNNPEAFSPIPAAFKEVPTETKKQQKLQTAKMPVEKVVKAAFDKIGGRVQNELNIVNIKIETINELYNEIVKGGVCLD